MKREVVMSYAIPQSEMSVDADKSQLMYLQLGLFFLLFLAMSFVADTTAAYAPSCSGVASLSGPLLPVVV